MALIIAAVIGTSVAGSIAYALFGDWWDVGGDYEQP